MFSHFFHFKINNKTLQSIPILQQVEAFAVDNCMKLNKSKTKCMIFDLKKAGISAEFYHPISNETVCIEKELKVLGFWLNPNLNYQKMIDEKCKSARRSLWTLIRLREACFPLEKLVHVFILNIRSILDFVTQQVGYEYHGKYLWNSQWK